MTTKAQREANARYDRANTRQVSIKLNVNTDSDILAQLSAQPSVQGYLKRLVREDMLATAEDARIAMPMIDRLLADPLADAPRFSDMDEAVAYVETALGDAVSDFDVESIVRDVTDWVDGQLTLVRDGDEFWAACAEHDTTVG